jgi:hypothetical protein
MVTGAYVPREISKEEHQNSVSSGYIALQFTSSSGYPTPNANE